MAWDFSNGLLGLGGFGGGQQNMPANALLGDFYDPSEMRKYQLKQMLLGLGAGLMSEKGMGRGATMALAAGDLAGRSYRENALDAYKIKTQQDQQAKEDQRYTDEWTWRKQQAEAAAKRQAKADAMDQTRFGWEVDAHDNPKAPQIQSFYDEQGREYKAQWDAANQRWVPVGGSKAQTGGPSMSMTMPDGTVVQMGSGGNASLPAEMGSRLGLGQQFLDTDLPQIMPMIKNGDATGPIDYTQGMFGRGNSGIVQRRMASGVDALRRNLTGAGMSASEAGDYADRYLPQPTDDADTLQRKAESLAADLNAVRNGAIAGKSGALGAFLPGSKMFAPAAPPPPAPPDLSGGPGQPNVRKYNPATGKIE